MRRYLAYLCLLPLGAQQSEQLKCAVEGMVVNELTGEGIRRAQVVARRVSERSQAEVVMWSRETFGTGVYTDAGGAFRIDSLEPGRYSIEVMKAGYLLPSNRRREDSSITLAAGQTRSGLRFGLIPHGVIAGRVLDEEGEPMRNVTVSAMRTTFVRGRRAWTPAGAGSTNDRGEYRITELRSGRYYVMAQSRESRSALFRNSDGRPSAYVQTWFPGTPDLRQSQPVSVTPGVELGGFDIRMVRDQVFRISGVVTGFDGRPVTNYTTLVAPADGEPWSMSGALASGADGRFEVMGLRSGAWIISAQQMERGEGERMTGAARVEVRGSDVENVVIRMAPRMVVTGTVEVQGGAVDVKKVQVGLVATEAAPFGSSAAVAPEEDASFRVYANSPIRYLVQAWGEPAPNAYLAGVRIGTDEYLGRELDLSQGPPGPVRILFRTDAATVKLMTQPLDETLARQRLYAFLLPADENLRRLGAAPMIELRPAEQPQFRMVRPGDYWLVVADDPEVGSWDLAAEIPDFESRAVRVKAEANGAHAVEVRSVISVSGQ